MKKIVLSSLLVLSLNAQNMDELVDSALKNSPDIKISKSQLDMLKEDVSIARSYYLPSIDLSGGFGKAGYKYKNISNETFNSVGASASATQLIYDFGKTGGAIDLSKYNFDSYDAHHTQIISDKILEVRTKYYELLKSRSLIKVNEENVKLNEAQTYRAQRYYEAGIRTKIDVSDAKVHLIKSQIDYKNSLYDKELSLVDLKKSIGDIKNDLDVDSDNITFASMYSALPIVSQNINELVESAFKNRYEIKAYNEKIKASKASQVSVRGDFLPSLGLSAQYDLNSVEDKVEQMIPEKQWNALVALNWNIFSGFNTTSKYQKAKIDTLKSQQELTNLKLDIEKSVNDSFIYVQKKLENVKYSESLRELSAQKFDQAQKRYENGLSDFIELQQARQEYIDSLSALVISYYDYLQSVAKLNHDIGL
jgi:outer membrane protein